MNYTDLAPVHTVAADKMTNVCVWLVSLRHGSILCILTLGLLLVNSINLLEDMKKNRSDIAAHPLEVNKAEIQNQLRLMHIPENILGVLHPLNQGILTRS